MNLPCHNHGYPMAHLVKDCKMYCAIAAMATLSRGTPQGDNRRRKGRSKQTLKRVMSICAHTGIRSDSGHTPVVREAYAAAPVMMTRLPWSEHPITFDESDQPKHSVDVDRFPLVVSAVLKIVCATKIFMDGESDSNMIYWDTFKKTKDRHRQIVRTERPDHWDSTRETSDASRHHRSIGHVW
jgi:hypothetical protein